MHTSVWMTGTLFARIPCYAQFLAERDRERLRTQELLWREASLVSRQSAGDVGTDGLKDRTFHTLIPQFCAFCGHPIVQYTEVRNVVFPQLV